jgi:hypothetical protein
MNYIAYMKADQKPILALLCIFLLGSLAACKKKEVSANSVHFSLNGDTTIVCSGVFRPGYDYMGGPNCEFEFDRYGGGSAVGNDEIGLFVNSDCNMVTGSLPYRTSNFTVATVLYGPIGPATTYSYPFSGIPGSGPLGNLTLTITGRESHRVVGSISGIIYRSDVGYKDSVTLDCSFDLDIPVTPQ